MVWSIFFFSEIIFFHVESLLWRVAWSIWRASCREYIDVHSFAIFAPTFNMTQLPLLASFCEISKYRSWLWIGEALVAQYLEHIVTQTPTIFPLHLETPVPEHDQVILRPQHLKTFVLDYDLEILRPERAISKSEVYIT